MITKFETSQRIMTKYGTCHCGKKGRRVRTFKQTVNPWNRHPDGTPKTREEVSDAVAAEGRAWRDNAPYECGACESRRAYEDTSSARIPD